MAEVFIAAAPGEEAQARGLAEALGLLGFDATAGTPGENDIAKLPETAKAIVTIWSRSTSNAPWLAALGMLALERKKLISAEFDKDTTPAPFHDAPRINLSVRDRAVFKTAFQALIGEIEKLTPAKHDPAALLDAVAKARAALLKPMGATPAPQWRTLAAFAAAVLALFVVGFGAGRLINAYRSGEFLVATPEADASTTAAPLPQAETITLADLRSKPWRDIAAGIDEAEALQIKAAARRGDALAQTIACIAHMGGAAGFLPSPTAAREQCDAAAAQDDPAALYFSWVLHREAPHAGLDEATARGRLQRAAGLNWTPAQIDYALTLPDDQQAEAGRLLLAAAEANDPRGQYNYARWLRDSPAGPRDPSAAIPFLERAAQHSQPEATHMLATFYRDGVGVQRDTGRARALYEQAARVHYPASMFNLADLIRGGGVPDRERAVLLYRELACMRDERQIQPMAVQRLRALGESYSCR